MPEPEYPSNSGMTNGGTMPPPAPENPIIQGVKIKEPSRKDKIRDAFISKDIPDLGQYLVYQIAIPAVKQAFSDAVIKAINGIFGTGTTGTVVRTLANQLINVQSNPTRIKYEQGSAAVSKIGVPTSCNYDGFTFPTLESIESVMYQMREILEEYSKVRISDLYEKCGITPPQTAHNFGWRDLRGMDKILMGDGRYLLHMPTAIQLN